MSTPRINPVRLSRLCREAVDRCRLDLSGAIVLTEAATGAYVVTPILAALAGAGRVFALARASSYGTVEEVVEQTESLARAASVSGVIEVMTEKTPEVIALADVVTNSGHVRPIDRAMVERMKPTSVVPLMYESWEFRDADIDLQACRERGILVAGTNERHPAVDVFSYLGIMAVKLLLDAEVAVFGSRILLLSDNPFEPYIRRGLVAAGASVKTAVDLVEGLGSDPVDAVVVAMQPRVGPILGPLEAELLAKSHPGVVVGQFWGDLDRDALDAVGIAFWPRTAPARGHMGILPSGVGPEPIVRLQTGGLKVAEVLMKSRQQVRDPDWEFVDAI
ncbi:hypothetical protein EP7_005495 (plasmid) [Isosphaeraceae bacterium EP7]